MEHKALPNILFITSTRLGDAVLSTGLLHHFIKTYPKASITVAAGRLPLPLFKAMPNITRLIAIDKKPYGAHWLTLYKQVYKTKWDVVVDLRDSLISRLLWAKTRHIYTQTIKKNHAAAHKVIQLSRVLSDNDVYTPTLYPDPHLEKDISPIIANAPRPIIAIGPTANYPGKSWPLDYYITLCQKILKSDQPSYRNASIMILASKTEETSARALYDSLPEGRRIDMIAKGNVAVTAAALQKADFYLGNDSGLMHMAAALNVPTFGLFGPSDDRFYRPFGDHCAFIRTVESAEELLSKENLAKGYHQSLMTSLTVQMVYDAMTAFLQKGKDSALKLID
jgi:ADP-heptose:LPS heptosyltransferase